MSRSIRGRTFDFALIRQRSLVDCQNASVVFGENSYTSTAKDFETIFKPAYLQRNKYNLLQQQEKYSMPANLVLTRQE